MKLNAGLAEDISAERPALSNSNEAIVGGSRIGALRKIEAADAEILLIVLIALKCRSKRVPFGQCVIDASAEIHALRRPADIRGVGAAGARRIHARGIVKRRTAG